MRNLVLALLLLVAFHPLGHAKTNNFSIVVEHTGTETLDLGQTGASMGDIVVTRGLVLNSKSLEKMGSYIARKIIISVDTAGGQDERDTLAEYLLPDGTITINGITSNNSGTNLPSKTSVRPIVGGSGKYLGVRGTSTVSPIAGQPNRFLINLKFK